MIWITSDQHFFHKNIISLCDRPFKSVEEMNEKLINNFNSKISSNDFVIHLGDMVMGDQKKNIPNILSQLTLTKSCIIRGNHDIGFKGKDNKEIYLDNGIFKVVDGIWNLRDLLIFCKEQELADSLDRDITLCHFPSITSNNRQEYETKYDKYRPTNFNLLFCGHSHQKEPIKPETLNVINVGVDAWGFFPIELKTLLNTVDNYCI